MNDRLTRNEKEKEARRSLVSLVQNMIDGDVSFLEGAIIVHSLRSEIGGIKDEDEDFNVFTAIVTETDHFPTVKQRGSWNREKLAQLEPKINEKEEWARSIGLEACRRLIKRFS